MEYKITYRLSDIISYHAFLIFSPIFSSKKNRRIILIFGAFFCFLAAFRHILAADYSLDVRSLYRISGAAMSVFIWLLFLCLFIITIYFIAGVWTMTKAELHIEYLLTARDGLLTSRTGSGYINEYSCQLIDQIRRRGRLIWIYLNQGELNSIVVLVPRHIFASSEEEAKFIHCLEEQKKLAAEFSDQPGSSVSRETSSFTRDFRLTVEMICDLNTQASWIHSQNDFSDDSRLLIRLTLGSFLFLAAVRVLIFDLKSLPALILVAVIMVLVLRQYEHPKKSKNNYALYQNIYLQNYRKFLGHLKHPLQKRFSAGPERILFQSDHQAAVLPWTDVRYLVETDTWFLFYGPKKRLHVSLPKSVFRNDEELEHFRRDCLEHCPDPGSKYLSMDTSFLQDLRTTIAGSGDTPEEILKNLKDTEKSAKHRRRNKGHLFVIVLLVIFVILQILASNSISKGYHEHGYDKRISLSDQVLILESLDLDIPSEIIDLEREWMENDPEAWKLLEGSPFTELLADSGMPEWDDETGEVSYPQNQACTVFWEVYDLETDYLDFLAAVSNLSDGAFSLTEPSVDLSETAVTAEEAADLSGSAATAETAADLSGSAATTEEAADLSGSAATAETAALTGTVRVRFLLNGTPYQYDLTADETFLDQDILRCVNLALEQEQISGKLFALDDIYRCVLFFREPAWAERFTEKTGLLLVSDYQINLE